MKVFLIFAFAMSTIFFSNPVAAGNHKQKTQAYAKKMKQSRAKNKKYLNMIVSEAKKQILNEKIQKQEELKKAQFNPALAKAARNQIKAVSLEWGRAKTFGDWIEKSPKKFKIKRRIYFSKYMNTKVPAFLSSDYSLALSLGNNKDMVMTLYPSMAGMRLIINGVDVTPKKNEKFPEWAKRKKALMKKIALFNWGDLFFSKAWAVIDFDNIYAGSFGYSAWQDWENQTYDPEGSSNSEVRFAELLSDANMLRRNYGLSCTDDWGFFEAPLGGISQPIRTNPPNSRGAMITMDFLEGRRSGTALGTLAISNSNHLTTVSLPFGTEYSGSATIPVVQAIINRTPPPELNFPLGRRAIPTPGTEVAQSIANLEACTAAQQAGADTSMCNPSGPSNNYGRCLIENLVQGDLQVQRSLAGGVWNSIVGSDPVGGVHSMDRNAALALKARLLGIYRDSGYQSYYPGSFPNNPGGSITFGITDVGSDAARQALAHGEDGSELQTQMLACWDALIARQSCDGNSQNLLSENIISNLRQAAEAARSYTDSGPSMPELRERLPQLLENAPASCRSLVSEEVQKSLADHAALEDISKSNNEEDARAFSTELQRAFLMADIAHTCCGNTQCRSEIQGTSPGRTGLSSDLRPQGAGR